MTTTINHSACEVCGNSGTYRRNYDSCLCDDCVAFDYAGYVPKEITEKYLPRKS